jgi:hypothetical protein
LITIIQVELSLDRSRALSRNQRRHSIDGEGYTGGCGYTNFPSGWVNGYD